MDMPFIDIHTHHSPSSGEHRFSFGIHPWWLGPGYDPRHDLETLERLLQEKRIVAIGETGIDRIHHTTLPQQLILFEQHISLSEQYQKPLIIHDVHGTDMIMQMHKKHQPSQTWIIHGFNGSVESAHQLTDRGICLSIGESVLYENRKISKTITSLSLDNLFFETDTSEHTIQEIYEKASERLGIPLSTLKEKIFANFARLNIAAWETERTSHDYSSETMALINMERALC